MDGSDPKAFDATNSEFCNLPRLWDAMAARNLDGLIITQPLNVYYLSRFNAIAHKSDEPRPYALVLSRHDPNHPILILADYYLSTFINMKSWIEDVRPFRAVMMPLDLPADASDIDRFITREAEGEAWAKSARANFRFDMKSVLVDALDTLKLSKSRIGFDDLNFAHRLGLDGITPADAYDAMMFARTVKTPNELALLEKSTKLNETAIRRTMADWAPGATWRDMDISYAAHVAELGGFVRDPGGMVWGHPRGSDPALVLNARQDHAPVERGTHVMFDCHGTLDLYCWDGGKTWVIDGEPEGLGKQLDRATHTVAEALVAAMKPGARVSELQALGRQIYRKSGVPNADEAVIFFHGLGLSHMDLQTSTPDGKSNTDWVFEEGMVAPLHLLYPGGENERIWLEEVVSVEADGGRPLFSWGYDALTGQ